MNKTLQVLKYLGLDYLGSAVAWGLFFVYRKVYIEKMNLLMSEYISDENFIKGILGVSGIWILIYALLGNYRHIYKRSRLIEFGKTIAQHFVGVIIIFFLFLIDDQVEKISQYYTAVFIYFLLQTFFVFLFRYLLLRSTNKKIHTKKIGYPTLLVGGGDEAVDLYVKMENNFRSSGNIFEGYLSAKEGEEQRLSNYLPNLGNISDLFHVIKEKNIQEVIVATAEKDHKIALNIIEKLEDTPVEIKTIPTMYDILSGSVRMSSMFAVPLITIETKLMPVWQSVVKRILDIIISASVLLLLSPFYIFTAILVRMSSKGPIFYKQKRIGIHGKPFNIIKFRSMYLDAEACGPQLSKDDDPRITPWGKIMRKYRIDEMPQFFNVLIGEMSIVGPRPERDFYIQQLVKKAPYYRQLHRVRPGITSWGMVKFGYAENLEEMLERLKFDLIYIENLSLLNDFKVLVYTILIVLQGRGK